ncbi:MAG: hypothetical protein ACT6FG_07070 [Methanosarcinaceae archaeon]
MKTNIKFGISALLAAMLLMSMVFVPAVSAKDMTSASWSVESNEKQIDTINQLWGQPITIGEYMEKVYPDILEKLPSKTLEHYYSTEMVWSDLSEQGNNSCESTASFDPSFKSQNSIDSLDIIFHNSNSDMDVTESDIDFNSWTKIIYPYHFQVPSMTVYSYLWYDDGNSENIVDAAYEHKTNVYKIEASDSYSVDSAGEYRVTGSHYIIAPPGYNPPEWSGTTNTNWEYVSP